MIDGMLADLPLVWPAAVVGLAASALLAGPVARLAGARWPVAFLLLGSVALIGAATLTPTAAAMAGDAGWAGDGGLVGDGGWVDGGVAARGCAATGFAAPGWWALRDANETSLNVALFVPLGIACGLLPRAGRALLAGALAAGLSPVVEATQYAWADLDRVCSSADVSANLTGLAAGLALSLAVLRPVGWLARQAAGAAPPHPPTGRLPRTPTAGTPAGSVPASSVPTGAVRPARRR